MPRGHTDTEFLRGAIGIGLMLTATGFLIQGGFSRYAKYGIPSHTDWRMIALGLIFLFAGGFLIRPGYFLRRHSSEASSRLERHCLVPSVFSGERDNTSRLVAQNLTRA